MKLLTSAEAAKRLGVSSPRVRALIAEGRLPATRFGHVWMIAENDLAALVRLPPGRPRSAAAR